MKPSSRPVRRLILVLALANGLATASVVTAKNHVQLKHSPGSLAISVDGQPFAQFVYQDEAISRPYFAHIKAPGGIQVTRNHPPVEGVDSPDHATFHPGLWLSFGDISGSDYWRLAAPVKFDRFLAEPASEEGYGRFAVRFKYLDERNPDEVLCSEDFHCEIQPIEGGCLILWDSTFSSDREYTFGDQEEMGLGFRIATPIRAERNSKIGLKPGNGEIVNSRGGRNEEQIWGKTAVWCDYRGALEGRTVGIAVFPHPENFRPCWFHVRDYGMLVANPFGRQAFGKGEKSAVTVKPGETFRLRYGVFVHASAENQEPDIAGAYNAYLRLARQQAGK
ncbi:MAG TPA: DUF6807 family protein [Lacipirellula sp.]